MRMRYTLSALIVSIVLLFSQASPVGAQYTRAEVSRALRGLESRGLLQSFISKYKSDAQQTVTRTDLLVVSYGLVNAMASQTTSLGSKIDRLEAQVRQTPGESRPGVEPPQVSEMVKREVNEAFPRLISDTPVIAHMRRDISQLKKKVQGENKAAEENPAAVEKLNRQVTYNRIIAGTSVVVALVSTILMAR